MSDQPHTRGDASTLEDDFEWVNAWATSMRPATPAAAPSGRRGADVVSEIRNRARTESAATNHNAGAAHIDHVARRPKPASPVVRDANDRAAGAPNGDDAIAALVPEAAAISLAGRRAGRWTNLFRLASRASAPADAARELFVLDAPGTPASPTATDTAPARTSAANDADLLARDIAEITRRRDQLLAMSGAAAGGRPTAWRTSDYVPIVVGAVLAFTSLIVFGAAASFVSLR